MLRPSPPPMQYLARNAPSTPARRTCPSPALSGRHEEPSRIKQPPEHASKQARAPPQLPPASGPTPPYKWPASQALRLQRPPPQKLLAQLSRALWRREWPRPPQPLLAGNPKPALPHPERPQPLLAGLPLLAGDAERERERLRERLLERDLLRERDLLGLRLLLRERLRDLERPRLRLRLRDLRGWRAEGVRANSQQAAWAGQGNDGACLLFAAMHNPAPNLQRHIPGSPAHLLRDRERLRERGERERDLPLLPPPPPPPPPRSSLTRMVQRSKGFLNSEESSLRMALAMSS